MNESVLTCYVQSRSTAEDPVSFHSDTQPYKNLLLVMPFTCRRNWSSGFSSKNGWTRSSWTWLLNPFSWCPSVSGFDGPLWSVADLPPAWSGHNTWAPSQHSKDQLKQHQRKDVSQRFCGTAITGVMLPSNISVSFTLTSRQLFLQYLLGEAAHALCFLELWSASRGGFMSLVRAGAPEDSFLIDKCQKKVKCLDILVLIVLFCSS